jgi:hypothetical protein
MKEGLFSTEEVPAAPNRRYRLLGLALTAVLLPAAAWYVWPFFVPASADAASFRDQGWCKAHEGRPIRLTGAAFLTLDGRGPLESDGDVESAASRQGGHYTIWMRDKSKNADQSEFGEPACSLTVQSAQPAKRNHPLDMVGTVCGYSQVGGTPGTLPDGNFGLIGGRAVPVFCEKGTKHDRREYWVVPNSEALRQVVSCMQ